MNKNMREKAARFLSLHNGPDLLLLPNIWNPVGARILEAGGYPAAATASAAVSASLGYEDGEKISRSTLIDVVARIARSVNIPVTADIEAGYAAGDNELMETVVRVIEAGIVGINIEDSLGQRHRLRPVDEQCGRIRLIRETANGKDLHLVINARIDSFMSDDLQSGEDRIEDAAARAAAYADAGADCVYPIGPGDRKTVTELRSRIKGPVNILASERAEPLNVLRGIGINRVSFGPFIFRSCLKRFIDIVKSLEELSGYSSFTSDTISAAEVQKYLRGEYESDG